MSMTRTLVRLYPASFRERWGPMLEADARSAGWRSWPSLVTTAIDMWLHPVVWPAESASQRRHRAAAMALTVAMAICVAGRVAAAAAANGSPLAQQSHRAWNLTDCGALIVLGMALVLPLPRLTRHAVAAVLRRAVQALAAPLILGAGSLIFVHSAHLAVMSQTRLLVADCFWLALAVAAVQVSRIVCTLGTRVTVPPRPARLRLGIAVLITGGALASWIIISTAMSGGGLDALSAAAGGFLLIMTYTFVSTLRDLNRC